MRKKGILVSFEGIDKSGKTTQIAMLKKQLEKERYTVKTYSALEDSFKYIKNLILDKRYKDMDKKTELLLYMVDRSRMTLKLFKPLNEGNIVIVDRYIDSSIVYQGAFRKINLGIIHQLNEFVTEGLKPDLTFVLQVNKEDYLKRINEENKDRLEIDVENAYDLISNAYIQIASTENRFYLVKPNGITEMNKDIYKELHRKIAMLN